MGIPPQKVTDPDTGVVISWRDNIRAAFAAKGDDKTSPMPPTRITSGLLASRVRRVRIETTLCLAKHGDKGVRIPYDTLFGRVIKCREHSSVLSMLSIEVTRFEAEGTVPSHPFQLCVSSDGRAPCCSGCAGMREWTDPHYAHFAHTDTSDNGVETTVMTEVRRMFSPSDAHRMPLVLFDASPTQSTEAHISEQSALAKGIASPFRPVEGVYHVPIPVEVDIPGGSLHFVTDYNATRLMVVHATRVAPQAGELIERDGHFVVSTQAVDALERYLRDQHTEQGTCTVIPHADLVIRVLPAHPDGHMGRTVVACAESELPLLISVGFELTVVVAGEPAYECF